MKKEPPARKIRDKNVSLADKRRGENYSHVCTIDRPRTISDRGGYEATRMKKLEFRFDLSIFHG
jgi:hypothetical protein